MDDQSWGKNKGQKDSLDISDHDPGPWEIENTGGTQIESFATPSFDNLPDMFKETTGVQTAVQTKPSEIETGSQDTDSRIMMDETISQDEVSFKKPPIYEPKVTPETHVNNEKVIHTFVPDEAQEKTVQRIEGTPSTFFEAVKRTEGNTRHEPHKERTERNKITGILGKVLGMLKGRSLVERMNEMRLDDMAETPLERKEQGIPPNRVRNVEQYTVPTPEEQLSYINFIEDKNVHQSVTENDLNDIEEMINSSTMRFDKVEDEIGNISTSIATLRDSTLHISQKSKGLDAKITTGLESSKERMNIIENRIMELEGTLNSIRSDSTDLMRGLVSIENNISELASSYSTLLTQVDESATYTDSRLIEISKRMEKMDILESKVVDIERGLTDSTEVVSEIGRTISALMGDVAENYSSNENLRAETKEDIETLKEEMKSVVEYVETGLKKTGAGTYGTPGVDVQLTYIEKNSSTMKLCMEWMEMLMELVGRNNLPDILSYYEELGWISDEVRLELLRYAEGIDYYMEKPDWKLNPGDHVKSIWFIEKLAGAKVDKNRLSMIERDIEKVRKGEEKIYGI